MLFISIMAVVWFGFWLYFTYQKDVMMQIITSVVMESVEEDDQEEEVK